MSTRGTLQRIQPLHADLIPPQGAVPCGVTKDGKQLFRLVRRRSRSVPDINPETGTQKFRKSIATGEPLYPLRKPEVYDEEIIFFLESQGNGNVGMVPWIPPSAEELAKAELAQKVKDMQEELAKAMVEGGINPATLVAAIKGGSMSVAQPAPAPVVDRPAPEGKGTEPDKDYPVLLGGGWWRLSNGQKFQGKRTDAEDAELAVMEAREKSGQTPEE